MTLRRPSFAVAHTRTLVGIESPAVDIEVHLTGGLPRISMVGLAETGVKESRVRSALINAGFDFPQKVISVNLAPAELSKRGGRFDLAIAIATLAAANCLPADALAGLEFVG